MKRLPIFSNDHIMGKLTKYCRIVSLVFGVFILSILVSGEVLSEKATQGPGDHVLITEVFLTDPFGLVGTGVVTIMGSDFDFGGAPVVGFGDFDPLNVTSSSSTIIVADLPAGLFPGDYLLTVSTGKGQSKNDEYDLTVPPMTIPSTSIAFFPGDCPPGWTEFAGAQGRAIVGLVPLGTPSGIVGAALIDLEDRAHNHPFGTQGGMTGDAGSHNHDGFVGDGGQHDHTGSTSANTAKEFVEPPSTPDGFVIQVAPIDHAHDIGTQDPHTHFIPNKDDHQHSIAGDMGDTGDANTSQVIPYIQLNVCQKD